MALAKEKLLYDDPTDYEDDLESWSYEPAELLRQRRFVELDIPNLIEEIESMGSEQRSDLLKGQFQPQLRSASWEITIGCERHNIEAREEKNRALRENAKDPVEQVCRGAIREAAKETGLPYDAFPFLCPYTVDQLRDAEWMPV